MSIWTYKNNNSISPNTYTNNGNESARFIRKGIPTSKCVPDIGSFGQVQIFRIADLNTFYSRANS